MGDTEKPRQIRDIAHIYLSRIAGHSRSGLPTLLIAGLQNGDFSALHAANLAAALVSRELGVRVFELSGLLPNVCFYFGHSPAVYLGHKAGISRGCFAGLHDVQLSFDIAAPEAGRREGGKTVIDLIHLPPIGQKSALEEALGSIGLRLGGGRAFICVKRGGAPIGAGESSVVAAIEPRFRFVLRIDREGAAGADSSRANDDLGAVWGWEETLTDRLPVVWRDPKSDLARAYRSVSESLLCRIQSFRRKSRDGHAGQIPSSGPTG